ncbi:MAG: GtrA family protein [Acidobacteriaceae bacterium]|nr:GtrA family protein [Acidobacteriaceae bacterium]
MNNNLLTRWLRFNAAGLVGVIVQLAALATLTHIAGFTTLTATACAVEAAILHNFIWHERYTWADRTRGAPQLVVSRLLRFNLSNGAVSLLGNLVLMKLLVDDAHLPLLPANLIAIVLCSTFNFLLSEYVVFAPKLPNLSP